MLQLLLYHENEAKAQYIIVIILVCVVERVLCYCIVHFFLRSSMLTQYNTVNLSIPLPPLQHEEGTCSKGNKKTF